MSFDFRFSFRNWCAVLSEKPLYPLREQSGARTTQGAFPPWTVVGLSSPSASPIAEQRRSSLIRAPKCDYRNVQP